MNRFTISLIAFASAVKAVSLESKTDSEWDLQPISDQPDHPMVISAAPPAPTHDHEHKPLAPPTPYGNDPSPYEHYDYYQHPGYATPDYTHEYVEPLPGADFNRQVYKFDEDHPIWDQDDYAHRVTNEAEILVALEALKESIVYLSHDVRDIQEATHRQRDRIMANRDKAGYNMEDIQNTTIPQAQAELNALQHKCSECEYFLHDSKDALILYCQQFAWAPEMVAPCAAILDCRGTELHYRYAFPGNYVHQAYGSHDHGHDVHYDDHLHDGHYDSHHDAHYDSHHDTLHDSHYDAHVDHYDGVPPAPVGPPTPSGSTHGIDLPLTGGNVPVAPGTNAELAATAVAPNKSVLQVDGQTIVVDHDEIDTNKVEVACNDEGCALILDDGNPHNDLIPDQPDTSIPAPDTHYHDAPHGDHSHDIHYPGDIHHPSGPPAPDAHYHDDHSHDIPHPEGNFHDVHQPISIPGPDAHYHGDVHGHDGHLHDLHHPTDIPHPDAHFPEVPSHPSSIPAPDAHYHGDVHGLGDHSHDVHHPTDIPHPDAHYHPSGPAPDAHYHPSGPAPDAHYHPSGPAPDAHYHPSGPAPDAHQSAPASSHGIELNVVGGNSYVAPGTDAELAAAAVDPNTVVIQHDGQTFYEDINGVDTDKVELACNDEGCALILDDGNPYNDIQVQSANPYATINGSNTQVQSENPMAMQQPAAPQQPAQPLADINLSGLLPDMPSGGNQMSMPSIDAGLNSLDSGKSI